MENCNQEEILSKPSEKTAIAYKGEEISYSRLHANIDRFRRSYTIDQGDRAVLFAENRPEWIYTFYSVWCHRGVAVTIDMSSNAEDVRHILRDCLPSVVFYSDKTAAVLESALQDSGLNPVRLNFDHMELPEPQEAQIRMSYRSEDTAVIIYTSGTTGSPKGVMLSYRNLSAVQEGYLEEKYYVPSDRVIAILPFHHVLPLQGNILIPLRVGALAVLLERLDSETILAALQKYKVTIIIGVPRLYRLLLDGIRAKIRKNPIASGLFHLSRMTGSYAVGKHLFKKVQDTFGGHIRYLVSGGSVLENEVLLGFKALGFKILNGYGLTETSPTIANNSEKDVRIGSVGKAHGNIEIRVIDEEIVVRGPMVMQGYYNHPQATAAVLRDGWFHTGDKGHLDEKGYLYVTGRLKEIIVLPNGKKVNPEEVEQKILAAHPILKELGVYQAGDSLGVILVPDFARVMQEGIVNLQETLRWTVIDAYNQTVPSYRKIHRITISRSELPRTKLGKLKRFLLPELAVRTSSGESLTREPEFEEYAIVKQYLQNGGKTDIRPYFHLELDLGLDSLDKVELLVFLERTFGVQLREGKLAEFPHLVALCEYLRDNKNQVGGEVINWKEILKEEIPLALPKRIFMLTLFKWVFKPLSRLYFRFEVKGLENVPLHDACILAPNHQSYMDALILASSLQSSIMKKTYFFAKEKHFHSALRRLVARNSNVIVMNLNSGLKTAIQETASVLKRGKNMVIFPEGARSRDGRLQPFKKTFAILSKELDVPVIPVAIKGAYESLSIGSWFPRPGKITLEFLAPLYPGGHDYDSLLQQTQSTIRQSL